MCVGVYVKHTHLQYSFKATSSLDSESESYVQDAVDKLIHQSKCTVVIIAHRLSTVINADQIAVLQGIHNVCCAFVFGFYWQGAYVCYMMFVTLVVRWRWCDCRGGNTQRVGCTWRILLHSCAHAAGSICQLSWWKGEREGGMKKRSSSICM